MIIRFNYVILYVTRKLILLIYSLKTYRLQSSLALGPQIVHRSTDSVTKRIFMKCYNTLRKNVTCYIAAKMKYVEMGVIIATIVFKILEYLKWKSIIILSWF